MGNPEGRVTWVTLGLLTQSHPHCLPLWICLLQGSMNFWMSLTRTGGWAQGAEYSVPAGPAQIVRIFGTSAGNKSVMEGTSSLHFPQKLLKEVQDHRPWHQIAQVFIFLLFLTNYMMWGKYLTFLYIHFLCISIYKTGFLNYQLLKVVGKINEVIRVNWSTTLVKWPVSPNWAVIILTTFSCTSVTETDGR